ncbi:hypothetical protein [Francisella philomiragia]|uniref:hypothetical protein n=1 Tax=Francisella philomiragia TaxID=28110 RepID=UPI001B8BADE4|nr:hypothetical protein [Francisella philomiragia]QUE32434.1 hypothetical protein IMS64_09580 [Francisella philomiragia]
MELENKFLIRRLLSLLHNIEDTLYDNMKRLSIHAIDGDLEYITSQDQIVLVEEIIMKIANNK